MERPQGYFVLFVGRRYYLRPNPLRSPPLRTLWNAQSATGTAFSLLEQSLRLYLEQPPALERPPGLWNGLWPLGTRKALLERPPALGQSVGSTRNARRGDIERAKSIRNEHLT